jgi:hypothetical protein
MATREPTSEILDHHDGNVPELDNARGGQNVGGSHCAAVSGEPKRMEAVNVDTGDKAGREL